jgi:spermidine/putrescine ABC transporter ATP-binding subunit
VNNVSIDIGAGAILSLLRPSGCGKTTVLRIVAGLLRPERGSIRLDGEDVTDTPPHRRKLGMVFQNYALFPHMSVEENVAFGLKMQGFPRDLQRRMINDALSMVRMGSMASRFPSELSGGQQQRVSLARAVVTKPRVLLLDEPFGALDRKLREEMQVEVKQLQRNTGLTFVFVTHDQEEALTLSDHIAVMRAGRVEQAGVPIDIFERPATRFVAEFFGTLNSFPVTVLHSDGGWSRVEGSVGSWSVAGTAVVGPRALFAVRTSDVSLFETEPPSLNTASGTLEDVVYKGTMVLCHVRLRDGSMFTAVSDSETKRTRGDQVYVGWRPEKSFLFPLTDPDNAANTDPAVQE